MMRKNIDVVRAMDEQDRHSRVGNRISWTVEIEVETVTSLAYAMPTSTGKRNSVRPAQNGALIYKAARS